MLCYSHVKHCPGVCLLVHNVVKHVAMKNFLQWKQMFLIVQIQVSLSLFWHVWFLVNALPYRYPGWTILFTENPVHMSSVTCYINDEKEIKSHHALLMFPLWPKQWRLCVCMRKAIWSWFCELEVHSSLFLVRQCLCTVTWVSGLNTKILFLNEQSL